jgi:YHS domain-containing protein
MQIRDPVCGMRLEQDQAVAVAKHFGRDYHFCSPSCEEAFTGDPDRFVEAETGLEKGRPSGDCSRDTHGDSDSADGLDEASTTCPFCGTETSVARVGTAELGSLSIEELETMVRNEWRRVLGKETYGRSHPRSLVRSLIQYARAPENSDRRRMAEDELWAEIAALEAWGLNRQSMRFELLALTQATLDILEETAISFEGAQSILGRIETFVDETLGWPAA